MKRIVSLALITGLIGLGASFEASAAKRKPVASKLYFHGGMPTGELQFVDNLANSSGYQEMDKSKPAAGAPKSMQFLGQPPANSACAGNDLFPLWVGPVNGTVVGNLKVTIHTVAAAATPLEIRVWPDVGSLLCDGGVNSTSTNYPKPAAIAVVSVPAGPAGTTFTVKNRKFRAHGTMMVQLTPVNGTRPAGRVLYDSPEFESSVAFKCIPAHGKSC